MKKPMVHSVLLVPLLILLRLGVIYPYRKLEQYTLYVDEGLPINTVVGQVGHPKKYTNPKYKLVNIQSNFAITLSGEVFTRKTFDHEKLTAKQKMEGYQLFLNRKNTLDFLTVTIFIKDVNDNRPRFAKKSWHVSVPEDVKPYDDIIFPNAQDPDTNQEVVYGIEEGNTDETFRVRKVSENNQPRYVLALNEGHELDVDFRKDSFNLTISACERISNLCSYLKVDITVTDINDNSPVFDKDLPKNVEIYENVSQSVPIFKVKVTDADSGKNSEVEFDIFNNNDFRIDKTTGEIFLATNSLDAETNDLITFLIIAEDKGTPSRKKTFYLKIKVLDCNDEAPILEIHPRNERPANLVEGMPVGTTIGSLTAVDNDLTQANNKIVTVRLTEGDKFFKLMQTKDEVLNGRVTKKYFIKTIKEIDREKTPSINLSISATDSGLPPLTGTVDYTIDVVDKNDNHPTFEKQVYETELNETAKLGSVVIQVKAVDLDSGINGRISYTITSKHEHNWFYIEENTGRIILNDYVDREQTDAVEIHVSARDHGMSPLSGKAVIEIKILDANDNDPQFVVPNMNFSLEENNKVNKFIGKMEVTDPDIIGSDHLTCAIDHPDFRVQPSTCKIYANKKFDREEKNRYTLSTTVKDGLGRSSAGHVVIQILDQNDNMPKFVSKFFNISVHTNFPTDKNAAFLKASDPDATDSSQFSAKILHKDNFFFDIDTYTGGIKLLNNLTKTKKTKFLFTAYVTDRKNPQPETADSARVQLNVLPPSTLPPVFEKAKYEFHLDENNVKGAEVGRVRAMRPVSHSELFIEYNIKSGNIKNIFSMGNFGVLKANQPIDYEEYSHFELIIKAVDSLHPTRVSNVTKVVINIQDVNDNTPRFINQNNVVAVNEGVGVGHLLYTCVTEDLDSGINGEVVYRTKHTTGHFQIHPTSGEVRTNGSLDFETSEGHVIYVEATDRGTPSRSAQFKIEVKVRDMNDNPPLFFNSSQIVSVRENNPPNQLILTLNASDADVGNNGQFFFKLLPNEDSKSFRMSPSGNLYVTKSLDRETKSTYSLKARVQDLGIPPQRSEATITVNVDDENDEAPKFQKQYYRFEVSEELQPGTTVGEVVAVDADTGENGKFTYYLRDQHNDKDKFEIETRQSYGNNRHVCVLKTKKKFDSEEDKGSYNITIGASDHGMNGNSNEVTVTIVIRNINDHPPEFMRNSPYVACINVGTKSNQRVLQVTATDKDKETVPLTYSLIALFESHNAALKIFNIDQSTGIIFTSVDISAAIAQKPMYEMVVSVQEDEESRLYTNYQKVAIFIAPKTGGHLFKESCPHVTIKSSGPEEQIVKNQWDMNLLSYTDLKYQLVSSTTQRNLDIPFDILTTTGIIKVTSNHHKAPYYQLNVTVSANDKTSIRYTEWILLNVYIVPKNMYPPSYPKNPETYRVPENYPINKPISSVLKTPQDRDRGMEGKCIFSIEDSVNAPVKVSPLTGEIAFTEPIDREKHDKIVIKIRVSDLAEELPYRLSNTLTVAIHIIDVNDCPPKFDSKSEISVREDEGVGVIISHVHASDPDAGDTKTNIEYVIVSGNIENTFELNRKTGELKTSKTLFINKRQTYGLQIMAMEKRDSTNTKSLNSTFDLTVRLLDVNNQKPRFLKSVFEASVRENQPIGTEVVQLQSVDDDLLPEYKEVIYQILDKNSGFYIDSKTGMIRTSILLDRENRDKYTLDVLVRNVASPYGEDTCKVIITIDDVNDSPPIFTSGAHQQIHILENSLPIPRSIHRLRHTDADDVKNSRVTFHIVDFVNPSKVLRLDSKTGQLWLNEKLDREQRRKYIFTVEAKNVESPYHKAQQNITIIVDDEDDEDPVFEKKIYRKTVIETQKVDVNSSPVLYVKAIDADTPKNAFVRYSLVDPSQDVADHFEVDIEKGAIHLIKSLDYEERRSYTFKVKAEGKRADSFDQTTVEIQVQDKNDNKPVFTKSIYEFSVPQIKVGAIIGTVKATDRDQDGRQQVRYRFEPPDRKFQINRETGDVQLMEEGIIHGQYRLHVLATDIGLYFTLSNRAEILVTVGQSDDKTLRFLNSSVVFSIDENPENGIRLGKVVAVSDNADNVIRYTISKRSNPDYAFRIDETQGDIYVNNSVAVDYEKRANFFLDVLATIEKVERFLNVLVNLTDVNDNDPQILEKDKTFNIPETDFHPFVHPKLIYTFHVRDDDKIDQNRLKLQIISGNEDGLFYISPRHIMYLIKEMDYEKKSKHNLVVRVTDGGNPYRYADSYINFNVEDLNDNKPILDKMQPVLISEAAKVDTLVTQVHADDNDKTKTDIKYSIEAKGSTPSNNSMFSIDEYSGKIFLQHRLDYETNHSFKLRICAFDGVHRTYGDLQINVQDVNDHSPRFSKAVYTIKNVYTPLRKNQFIIKVDATDPDQGNFGFVQYKLETSLDPFMIEQDTGKIYANKPFQFSPGIAKLKVIAYDSKNGKGSRSSTALVEIHVSQLHQPNPYFRQPSYRFSIEEHTPDGVPIGYVEATVQNGYKEFTYRITDGNTGGVFSMEEGTITTYKNLDRETKSQYTLTVVAEVVSLPREKNPLTASCTVHIEIKDINDNQPVFEKQAYHVTQYEDIKVGTKLLQVKATDADDPRQANGKLTYSIHSGQEGTKWLRINETDGWIETREELDRETTDTIQLTIQVADTEGKGMEAYTSLNVTVLDVNDNAPGFNYDHIRFNDINIKENMPPHSMVFRAGAMDKDIGENGRVSYKILELENGGQDYFYMNESFPGWVYTKTSLDYEKSRSYTLRVLAYDHGTPSKQASMDFEIAVEDVNEYQPVFREKGYSFGMFGDMPFGSVIGNISATDRDGGPAGRIYYSIHPTNIDDFRIHVNTGVIVVNKDLRRQKITNSLEVDGKNNDNAINDDQKRERRRRSLNSIDDKESSEEDLKDIRFQVRADNGPNTTAVTTDIVVRVNYTCPGCVVYTHVSDKADMKGTTTTVVVVASIAVFLMIIFITCMAYFLRKKGCFNRGPATARFCNTKKEPGLSNSVERELLNSGASSFDRLQHFYNGDHPVEKSQVSSETGLLPDGSGTGRSVSAADKASTYSFGIYAEQGKTDSEMHRLPDTLSEITMIKELEDDSVFGYSSGKMKSEPTKSLISRSTQESSLYSLNSAVHRNGCYFVPRQSNKMISTNRSDSHESLKDFMEEGGGEAAGGIDVSNLLYAKLAEVNEDERDAIMESVRPFQEEGPLSYGGSFSTIIGSEEDLRRAYDNPYNKYNWKPPYQNSGTNSVFSEIGRKMGGGSQLNHPSKYSFSQKDIIKNNAAAKQPLLHDVTPMKNRIHFPGKHPKPGSLGKVPHQAPQPPAPPIDIPLHVLNSGRTSMLSSVTSLPRLPQELQSTYTSGILSPNFTPALTPLVFRSPSVSSIGTQEEFNTQNNNKQMTNNFNSGFNSTLHRSDSRVSQLSRITLSDLEISDAEIGV